MSTQQVRVLVPVVPVLQSTADGGMVLTTRPDRERPSIGLRRDWLVDPVTADLIIMDALDELQG